MTNTQSCKHKNAKMLTRKGHDLLTIRPNSLMGNVCTGT